MDFISNVRKLSVDTLEEDGERRIKRSKPVPSFENDNDTRECLLSDDAKKQMKLILASDRDQIIQKINDLDNNLLKAHRASQRLSKFCGSQSVYDYGNQILEKVETHIVAKLEELYVNFSCEEDGLLSDFPLCQFYRIVWSHFKFTESALYPLFHGLNRSISTKVKISKPEQINALNSIYYPITEIQFLVCKEFISKFANATTDKLYGMQKFDKILDASTSRLCKSLKALFLNELTEDEDSIVLLKLTDFYLLCHMLEVNTGKYSFLTSIFQKCYVHTLKTIKRILYTDKYMDTVFEKLQYLKEIENKIKSNIFETLHDSSLVVFKDEEIKLLFSTDTNYLSSVISNMFLKLYHDIDNSSISLIMDKMREFYDKYDFEMSDWNLGASQFVDTLYQSMEPVNEDKLKDMVKLFTSLTEMACKVQKISLGPQYGFLKNIFQEALKSYWSNFKRDFAGHYAFYLDYRLKLISKSKDRIKLEKELEKVQNGLKVIVGFMNTNSRIKFKRMYATQFVQRMLGSLYHADFTLYTNISDCELEMSTALDLICKEYQYGEPMMDIYNQIQDSYERYKKFESFLTENAINHTGMDSIDMIALPEELNMAISLSSSTTSSDKQFNKMVLPPEMNQLIKEFRRFYKGELRRSRRSSEGKLLLQPSYSNSRMTVDYTLPNGTLCHLNCNMYHGIILTLFNDIELDHEGFKEADISAKLNIPIDVVNKSLNALGSAKFPILVLSADSKWRINTQLELSQKIINSGNVINISEKRKMN